MVSKINTYKEGRGISPRYFIHHVWRKTAPQRNQAEHSEAGRRPDIMD